MTRYYFYSPSIEYFIPYSLEEARRFIAFGDCSFDENIVEECFIPADYFYVDAENEVQAQMDADNYIGCKSLWKSLEEQCNYWNNLDFSSQCKIVETIMITTISNEVNNIERMAETEYSIKKCHPII